MMNPANPPLPTPWNLPFQLASGIHTSILMSESRDGLNVAATRQKAGNCLKAAVACTPPRPGAGAENTPAATDWVSVIVAFGNERAWRLSQVAACDSVTVKRTTSRQRLRLWRAPA